MGRKRQLSPERINEAIVTLCNREGAAHLTIDALAKEIGTTKSSVIYGSNKAEILQNFMQSGIARIGRKIAQTEAVHADAPNPAISAMVDLARRKSEFDLLAAGLAIAVSRGPDEGCRLRAGAAIKAHMAAIRRKSGDERRSMAAMIGVLGLCFGETLGLLDLAGPEREALLETLGELGGTEPPHRSFARHAPDPDPELSDRDARALPRLPTTLPLSA